MSIVKRSDKVAFWGIPGSGSGSTATYTRMKNFTSLSGSKNAKEYTRQYVDEGMERTDVTGYSPSWSMAFDEYTNDSVQEDVLDILDNDKTGTDAQREIIFVDFSRESTPAGTFPAVKRLFTVVGSAEGDGLDAYTHSFDVKTAGSSVKGTVAIATPTPGTPETAETVTFTAAT